MGDCHLARGPWGTNKKRNDLREVSVLSVGGSGRGEQVVTFGRALVTPVPGMEE